MNPPQTPTKTKGQDAETEPATPTKGKGGMSEQDSKFLIECLKNTKGNVTIDIDAVALALDYKNPRSVGNRLAILKKVYGLSLTTSSAASSGSVAGSPISPGKVTKPRASPKTPRKPKAAVVDDEDGDDFEGVKTKSTPRPRAKQATPRKRKTVLKQQLSKEVVSESSDEASPVVAAEAPAPKVGTMDTVHEEDEDLVKAEEQHATEATEMVDSVNDEA